MGFTHHGLGSKFGNLAIFTAIVRASFLLSNFDEAALIAPQQPSTQQRYWWGQNQAWRDWNRTLVITTALLESNG
jgi:hypothetical protein